MTSTLTRILAIAAVCALAVAGVADAKAPARNGGFKQATFKATLSGSQVTTWEYHRKKDKDDPCSASSDGYGDQTIKFDAKRKFKVQFTQPPKRQRDLFGTNGRPSVFTTPLILPVDATAERNGDYNVNYGEIDETNCDAAGGGGGDDNPPDPDCGKRDGRFNVRLYFHDPSEDALVVPLKHPFPDKNHLKLEGNFYEWMDAAGGSAGVLDFAYKRCPLLMQGAYVEQAGNIFTSPAKIAEKRLFNRKQKRIVVSGHIIQDRSEGDYTGKTIIAWNLRLTRVK